MISIEHQGLGGKGQLGEAAGGAWAKTQRAGLPGSRADCTPTIANLLPPKEMVTKIETPAPCATGNLA